MTSKFKISKEPQPFLLPGLWRSAQVSTIVRAEQRAASTTLPGVRACGRCGIPSGPYDHFCGQCGEKLFG